jgi:hypothetical protein
LKSRYFRLPFIGIAMVFSLIPIPNPLGIFLDLGILALAYPFSRKVIFLFLLIYNINPTKVDGVLLGSGVVGYFRYLVVGSLVWLLHLNFFYTLVVSSVLVVLAEYVTMIYLSSLIWKILRKRYPRINEWYSSGDSPPPPLHSIRNATSVDSQMKRR